jgi:cysteinyl-tRNA synthetase, unknown class
MEVSEIIQSAQQVTARGIAKVRAYAKKTSAKVVPQSEARGHTGAILLISACSFLLIGCPKDENKEEQETRDFRQDMRVLVQDLSAYARTAHPGFIVIPQNGQDLLTTNGQANGPVAANYVQTVNGQAQEDLFFGYNNDDEPTLPDQRNTLLAWMNRAVSLNLRGIVIDYCSTPSHVDSSHAWNDAHGFLSFAASHRELDNIPTYPPTPYGVHSDSVTALSQARNFLYLINPAEYADKSAFLLALQHTDYDAIIIDLDFDDGHLTAADVTSLRKKDHGGQRLVLCYMSIGEAEDYRFYWQEGWRSQPPAWLGPENPDWPGNFKVRYWDPGWHAIIFGNDNSYLKKILDADFDGVYLDLIDSFEFWE